MDPIQLPEDISGVDTSELEDLERRITERAEEIGSQDDLTDDDVEEINALVEAAGLVASELKTRSEAAASRRSTAADALARIKGEQPAATDEPEAVEGEVVVPDDASSLEDTPTDTAPSDEPVLVEASTDQKEPEVVKPDSVSTPGSAQALAARRPDAVAPRVNSQPVAFTATGFAVDPEGTTYDDTSSLARAIARKRVGMTHIPQGVSDDYVKLATYQKPEFAHQLGPKSEDNGLVFRQAQREAQALVASGAVCAPLDPVWEKITLGETFDADLEEALPTIGAPQGGIRFRPYSKADVTNMLAGVGHYVYTPTTGTQNMGLTGAQIERIGGAAGHLPGGNLTGGAADGPLTAANPKPCATLVCIDEDVGYIEAFSTCLKVDNLQYRITPDLVEEAQADLATAYKLAKEAWILAKMEDIATDMDFDFTGASIPASLGVLFAIETAAVGYRKAHLLSSTATVQAFIERGHFGELALDLAIACGVADPIAAMARMTEADIAAELRRMNIDPVFYTDPKQAGTNVADANALMALVYGTGSTVANAHTGGNLHVKVFIGAPGALVKLDGGTLDLGLVRDSVLNGTNDLQIFMEEWLGLCNRGIEMWELDIHNFANAGVRVSCQP